MISIGSKQDRISGVQKEYCSGGVSFIFVGRNSDSGYNEIDVDDNKFIFDQNNVQKMIDNYNAREKKPGEPATLTKAEFTDGNTKTTLKKSFVSDARFYTCTTDNLEQICFRCIEACVSCDSCRGSCYSCHNKCNGCLVCDGGCEKCAGCNDCNDYRNGSGNSWQ